MKTSELKRTCLAFRKGILNGRPSQMMCAIVSYALQGYLAVLGIPTKIVEGRKGHVWLEMEDGRIIDATADQFNGKFLKFPKVYIGDLPDFHRRYFA